MANTKKIPPDERFELSMESERLRGELRTFQPGERRSYAAVSAAVGFDVQADRPRLYRSREHLRKRDGVVFACIIGWGVERLTDEESVKHAGSRRKRIRGQARRGIEACATVSMENLTRDMQAMAWATLAQLGATLAVSAEAAHRRLMAQQGASPKPLTAGEFADATRSLFRRRLGGS